jgi:hypothetical protein
MAITLNNYLALGFPEIGGVPVGEAGTLNMAGEDFKYTPTPAECEFCAAIYADSLPKGRLWEAFTLRHNILVCGFPVRLLLWHQSGWFGSKSLTRVLRLGDIPSL